MLRILVLLSAMAAALVAPPQGHHRARRTALRSTVSPPPPAEKKAGDDEPYVRKKKRKWRGVDIDGISDDDEPDWDFVEEEDDMPDQADAHLILFDDETYYEQHVVDTLVDVVDLDRNKAEAVYEELASQGQAVAFEGPWEHAESFVRTFANLQPMIFAKAVLIDDNDDVADEKKATKVISPP
mmetsp:Transcript_9431/g.30782  ORF Transcript_9431/g.30782 Transcript_9431/m.30782 type:complete len:183 (+) Transcript_9431:1711-2259(+)